MQRPNPCLKRTAENTRKEYAHKSYCIGGQLNHMEVCMRRIILALSALFVLAFLAPLPTMAQAAQSWIRVMHDSPNAPNVDVFVDGDPVFENVAYLRTTNYQSLAPGQH